MTEYMTQPVANVINNRRSHTPLSEIPNPCYQFVMDQQRQLTLVHMNTGVGQEIWTEDRHICEAGGWVVRDYDDDEVDDQDIAVNGVVGDGHAGYDA